jgi:hypothetical protein
MLGFRIHCGSVMITILIAVTLALNGTTNRIPMPTKAMTPLPIRVVVPTGVMEAAVIDIRTAT